MADITMCSNKECPLREECYRAMAAESKYRQAYSYFKYMIVDGKPECEFFWPINDKRRRDG